MMRVSFLQNWFGIRLALGMALLACLPTGQLMAEAVQSERLQQTIENPGDVAFEERQELLDLAPLQQNIPLLLYGGRVSPTAAKEVPRSGSLKGMRRIRRKPTPQI
jgi:hypothetical protein